MELQSITFANLLRDYPVLFNKSQLPSVRRDKAEALQELKIKIEAMCGKTVDVGGITKKINNMKMRVKQKCDLSKTGNKPIMLKDWEKIIHELLEGDTNPAISRMPGGYCFGVVQEPLVVIAAPESEYGSQEVPLLESPDTQPPPPPPVASSWSSSTPKRKRNAVDNNESDETRGLTNTELQRLVLLKQLQVLEMKEKKLRSELEKM